MYKKTEAQRGKLNRPRPHSKCSEGLCFWAGGGRVLCTPFSRVLQPSSHDRALQRKSSKKALLLESSSRLPSDRLLPPPAPALGRWEACPPPPPVSALSPALTASQRTLPPLAARLRSSQAPLLAWPSPHSCLVSSSPWPQALGQRLRTSKVSRARQAASVRPSPTAPRLTQRPRDTSHPTDKLVKSFPGARP